MAPPRRHPIADQSFEAIKARLAEAEAEGVRQPGDEPMRIIATAQARQARKFVDGAVSICRSHGIALLSIHEALINSAAALGDTIEQDKVWHTRPSGRTPRDR
jgi:hypothetical protein